MSPRRALLLGREMNSAEKLERAMQDIVKLQIESDLRNREIERLRADNEMLKSKIASLPSRYEYWMGLVAVMALCVALVGM